MYCLEKIQTIFNIDKREVKDKWDEVFKKIESMIKLKIIDEKTMSRYKVVKKGFYIVLLAYIFYVVIFALLPKEAHKYIVLIHYDIIHVSILLAIGYWIMSTIALKREFAFYYSKVCFNISLEKGYQEEEAKLAYLIEGLKSYDSYLQKTLRMQIRNPDEIYDRIITMDNMQKMN